MKGRVLPVRTVLAGLLVVSAAALLPARPTGGTTTSSDLCAITTDRILRAMRQSQGYDLAATSNGPRLQADVLRHLIVEQEATDPGRRPLFIGHREWYEAFLARTSLAPSQAPLYARRSYEMGQDMVVDYRIDDVVGAVVQGPEPRAGANVWLYWAKADGKPDRYSYEDLSGNPHLRVTEKRLVTYRLLDYGDRVWYADVSGLRGRPTSGALGLLFDFIGEARVLESRSAIAPDGTQVVRGRATKWGIDKAETLTVWPDGHADRGVPKGRADLRALESLLEEPLAVRFKPFAPAP
jgi:hypothetical protein